MTFDPKTNLIGSVDAGLDDVLEAVVQGAHHFRHRPDVVPETSTILGIEVVN